MARSFNGTSSFIAANGAGVLLSTTGAAACSVALWVKSTGTTTGLCVYSDGGTSAEIWGLFRGFTDASKLHVAITDNNNINRVNVPSTAAAFDGTWHHCALTQDAARNWALYIDGVVDKSGNYAAGTFMSSPSQTTIGALGRTSTHSNFFGGSIAHPANWTRQLSAQEVKSLSNGLLPSHLGPAHYWPLWGVDSPEPDLVSAGVDGTLTGTTQGAGGPPVGLSLLRLAA